MNNIDKAKIEEALMEVIDPEVGVDIVTMGLVRKIEIDDDANVTIEHTLTSPMCPLGPQIQGDIREKVMKLGVQRIHINLTFEPPWQPPEDLRMMMGI